MTAQRFGGIMTDQETVARLLKDNERLGARCTKLLARLDKLEGALAYGDNPEEGRDIDEILESEYDLRQENAKLKAELNELRQAVGGAV
jgi:hypothetical protein